MAKAKREGTWSTPDEEPSPYPPRERRRRFWLAFGVTFVAAIVVGSVLHVVLGRPGSLLSLGNVVDATITALLPAFFVGWWSTRPPKGR